MTQTILRDRTGGAGYWTKGCLSCVERCCEGSNGPTRASSLHSRTALPQPQNDSRLGGTVSSSTHISLPPGSFSLQITETWAVWTSSQLWFWSAAQPCQHKPSLLTTSLWGFSPTAACCWLLCFHGAASEPLLPAMGQRQSQLRWTGLSNPRDLHLALAPSAKRSVLLTSGEMRREGYWDECHLRRTCNQVWLAQRAEHWKHLSKWAQCNQNLSL